MNKALSIQETTEYLLKRLLEAGVIVQLYEAYSTSSVYMKFDCGLANSLRIGDHKGKKHLNYMFMVDIKRKGPRKVSCKTYTQYIYSSQPRQLDLLIEHILSHRNQKMMMYFEEGLYREAVKAAYQKNKYQRGFWSQAKFVRRGQLV